MKKRFWKIFAAVSAAVLIVTVLAGVIYVESVKKSDVYVHFEKSKLNEVYTCLTILDNEGKVIEEPTYLNGYKQIPLDALNEYTYKAFVAVEDKRFFSHKGVDCKRVLGAIAHNIKSGRYKEGASTISQQLIKNTHLDNSKTFKRKLNEIFLAAELEKNYSKNEILEMYLNTIYFGRNAYGIETAANVYFNKNASELNISESAVLAGMIKAPNVYAPDKNAEKCKKRRDVVLKLMLEQKVINENEYISAVNTEITYCPQTKSNERTYVYQVMKEACEILNMTPLQLAKSDFIIETYCNQAAQKALRELSKRDETKTSDGKIADLSCVILNSKGGAEACLFRGEQSQNKRQAGSALKPIAVYAPALNERIITQASPVLDEETDFNGYKPANAGGYNGWTTIKNAVAKSLNVPAVKTLNALGLNTSQKYLANFGITGEQNLSLALGNANGGIDAITLAKCYATFSNDGKYNDAAFIKSINSSKGTIYNRELQEKRVFQSGANYLMTDLLINTAKNGTAKKLANKHYQIAAKTGTVGNADGNSDAIIAGYTTRHSFVVWYSGNLPNGVSGATAPCAFASSLLDNVYANEVPEKFAKPDGVVELTLDKNQLYTHQLQVVSADEIGEKFFFENANKPVVSSKPKKRSDQIAAEVNGNEVKIAIPTNENWQLYAVCDGKTELLTLDEYGKYSGTITSDTQFYAELYDNGKLIYVTPKVKVPYVKTDSEKKEPPSIKDFWYWG